MFAIGAEDDIACGLGPTAPPPPPPPTTTTGSEGGGARDCGVIRDRSAAGAWAALCARLARAGGGSGGGERALSPEFAFGFGLPVVARLLEGLPGALALAPPPPPPPPPPPSAAESVLQPTVAVVAVAAAAAAAGGDAVELDASASASGVFGSGCGSGGVSGCGYIFRIQRRREDATSTAAGHDTWRGNM